MPISFAIAALMAIVVSSYRQTVRAYPSGGGAYIVSKENLGTFAGLIAAAALLFDYMMTVMVSVVAGRVRDRVGVPVGEPAPGRPVDHVRLSRDVREPARRPRVRNVVRGPHLRVRRVDPVPHRDGGHAVPRRLSGGRVSVRADRRAPRRRSRRIRYFALLKAFSQGATALTGVEAISNGVPAFKRPQARNAATTLAIMGTIAVTMFLGISYLATHMHGVVASEERSAVAQIAVAIFGNNTLGFSWCSSSPRRS